MASRNYEKNQRKKREKMKAAARAVERAKMRRRGPVPFRPSFNSGVDLAHAAALMHNDALLRRLFR